jgi:hypothetical protein
MRIDRPLQGFVNATEENQEFRLTGGQIPGRSAMQGAVVIDRRHQHPCEQKQG